MKKLLFFIGLSFLVFNVSAREAAEARVFTPQAGDFALSIDATPFLNFAGNIFGSEATAPSFNNGVLRGRYFLSERNAIRATLAFDFGTDIYRIDVPQIGNTSNTVTNTERFSHNEFVLAVGYEFRRGAGRLQAFYGGELIFGLGNERDSFTYGNALGANNTASRVTERKSGAMFGVGLGGFVGVEYFIAPRISLGAEVGISLLYNNQGRGQTTSERWADGSVQTSTVDGTRSSGQFEFSTNAAHGGNIFISFFF